MKGFALVILVIKVKLPHRKKHIFKAFFSLSSVCVLGFGEGEMSGFVFGLLKGISKYKSPVNMR